MTRKVIYWVLGITALFLVLFHYRAAADVITAGFGGVTGTIKKLQEG